MTNMKPANENRNMTGNNFTVVNGVSRGVNEI